MFIALRDLAYAKGRFALMTLVIALIALLMTSLSGMSAGLIKNNISGLMELDVTHIAFEYDDRPTYRNTMIERAQWEEWAEQTGVKAMEPMGHTIFTARTQKDDPLELVLWGMRPASFLDPGTDLGDAIGKTENGVVISGLLAERDGVEIGDTITLDRVLTELEVIGIIEERNIGHIPIVYAPLPKWQEATYGPPGGPPPGEKLPAIVFDFVSILAMQLDESITPEQINELDEEIGTTTRDRNGFYIASTGYVEEVRTVQIIQFFLFLISAVVIGAFFATWTIQRTREIGLVKALGASNGYLLRDALSQALLVMLVGVAIGLTVGLYLGRLIMANTNMPYMLEGDQIGNAMVLLIVAGLVGGALSIRRITRVDPIIALGQEQ
ncbi:MAG: ABC transporter permease [Gammaproteobacteria bacterium]|nr:ABC transporter permease [Gammaproteobacteria bacterium]